MASTGDDTRASAWPRPDLLASLGAVLLAVILSVVLPALLRRSLDFEILAILGYLVYWLPLLGVALLVRRRRWDGAHPIAWRLTPIDVLWGLGAGFLLRAIAAGIELAMRGYIAAPSIVSPWGTNTVVTLTLALVAPILLAPLVEELFFRGTLLTSLQRSNRPMGTAFAAAILAAVIFALPHAITSTNSVDALVRFSSAAILALGTGALAVLTGRVGAAVITHVIFNASLLLLLVV